MPDEIFGVMAVKNGQKQTIMNLSNARQKSYADLQTMTDAQKKGVIVCPDYPKEEFLVTADEVSYGGGTVKDALDGKAEVGIYTINNQSLNAGLNAIAIPNSDITLSDTCISVYTNYAQSDVRLLSWTFVKTSSQWVVCINNSGSTISSATVVVVYIKA